MILHGIGASEGIGIGKAVCIQEQNLDYSSVKYGGRDAEKERLKKASKKFSEKTSRMAEHIKKQVGQKESEILTGQIMMLSDPFMTEQINDAIDSGLCAEAAVDQVCGMYAQMFAGVDNEMMRQRAADVKDIKNRMLSILLGVSEVDISELLSGVTLGPNWPTNAGATAAMTSAPPLMAWIVWKIWPLSTIAPNGQLTRHIPQETHLS